MTWAPVRLFLGVVATAGFVACSDEIGLGQVAPTLDVEPVIDFGAVPLGIEKKVELDIANAGSGVLSVKAVVPGEAFATAEYTFRVATAGFDVASKSTANLVVRFQPFQASGEQPFESSFEIQTANPDAQGALITKKVTVRGRGVVAGVEVTPNPVDFGTVLAGASRTLSVRITNLLPDPITLTSDSDGAGRAVARHLAGDGRFIVDAAVTGSGSLIPGDRTLGPGASIEVPIRYEPSPLPTMTADDGQWVISTCADDLCKVTVRLIGRSTDNAIACAPMALDFGAVNPGATLRRSITCTNVASDTVTVGPWALATGTDATFGMQPFTGSSTLAPGASYQVELTFSPTEAQLMSGAMAMGTAVFSALGSTGQPLLPVRIPLAGRAGGPTIVVTPEELHFGGIAIGTSRARRFVIVNDGYEDLIISDIHEGPAQTGDFSASPTLMVLPSGTSTVVTAIFRPSVEGPLTSSLVIESNDAIRPSLAIPADGVGVRLPPCQYTLTPPQIQAGLVYVGETATAAATLTNVGTDLCLINDLDITGAANPSSFTLTNGPETNVTVAPGASKVITVSFTPRTVGAEQATVSMYISDPANPNLDIPVSGIGGAVTEVTCPTPQTVPAGNPVVLSAMGMVVGRNVAGYSWRIVSAPAGGVGTPNQWSPDPPNAATVTFLPYIVGVYVLEATVLDDQGGSAVCQTTVTAEGHGLRVTMTWDGMGDIDLHLHRPTTMTPWFGQGGNLDDCYYGERTPIWDPMAQPATGANPQLDFDNTSANGPENTTVDLPLLNVPYTIGVHNFARGAGRLVTIEVYCGNGVVPAATFTSRPLAGAAAGNCTANDFWTVASVSFQNIGACTVTPIDTYRTSNDACTSF